MGSPAGRAPGQADGPRKKNHKHQKKEKLQNTCGSHLCHTEETRRVCVGPGQIHPLVNQGDPHTPSGTDTPEWTRRVSGPRASSSSASSSAPVCARAVAGAVTSRGGAPVPVAKCYGWCWPVPPQMMAQGQECVWNQGKFIPWFVAMQW